jgi:cyclophilin family peptidyl-prolyl cis-trans isomerase
MSLAACHAGHPASPRAALLHPEDTLWQAQAPDTFRADVRTTKGTFTLEVYRRPAPRGVDRFYNLARAGYYDDSRFFRTVPHFIAQFGIAKDPAVTAVWRDRTFPDDPPPHQPNIRGTFAFSMKGPDDRRTQIYINRQDNPRNDGQGFAILGRVIAGMDVVDSLYDGYGETSGGGMRAGRQDSLLLQGNTYLDRAFPKLDRLIRITIHRTP